MTTREIPPYRWLHDFELMIRRLKAWWAEQQELSRKAAERQAWVEANDDGVVHYYHASPFLYTCKPGDRLPPHLCGRNHNRAVCGACGRPFRSED